MKILDFLFPPSCPICNEIVSENGLLCSDCWAGFNWIANPKCYICGYPFSANLDLGPRPMCPVCAANENELDFIRAACVYDDVSKNIMLPFKYANKLKYSKVMTGAMIGAIRDLEMDVDIVLPVPLSNRRLWKRGYNQATVLARPIAKFFNVKMDLFSVVRKHREDMGHKNKSARLKNISGVFHINNPEKFRDKNVLIVDDVMTTGSTFSELNKVLKRAGAKSVSGVVFCRVVRAI